MATSEMQFELLEVVRLFNETAALVGSAGGAEESMARALNLVCAFTGWPVGHVYLFDPDTGVLRPADIWHMDDPHRVSPFVQATMRSTVPAGAGLAGRVLAAGHPLWLPDLGDDPRAHAAIACGIEAGLASPILGAQRIEGIVEFFPPSAARPGQPILDVLAHIGLELGNVVDRARLRDELEAGQALLAVAARLGRMGTWRYHVDRDLVRWSDELCALHGFEPAGAPRTLEQYLTHVQADDVERVRADILRGIETRQGFDTEYRFLFRGDEVRWAHARGEMARPSGAGNRSAILFGYCQDVTEHKLRLQAIQHGRDQLAEAERLAHIGAWSWNVVTNSVICSDELFHIAGVDPAESPTFETYFARVHPDDQAWVQAAVSHTIESRQPYDHDFRMVHPDGTLRWVNAHGEVVEEAGGATLRVAGFTQDITERRLAEEERARLERRLQQSQRLESLGQLAGGVAHDFNNLLSAILIYATFVEQEIASMARASSDPHYLELLADMQQVKRAAERAAEMTRRLLAFGRREVVRPVVLSLNDVVRGVEQLLRRSLGAHIELETLLEPDLWAVRADSGQLEQVLVNLAVNSRDAMPGGGTLTIETANVHLDAESAARWTDVPPGRFVSLRVGDTGTGMTKQVAERAFDPFFTTKPKGEGSGLGLATVHGIVAQAGGRVRIDSEPGAGTRITAIWPASDEQRTVAAAAPPTLADRRPKDQVILVVEDEAPLLEATRRMLSRNGYTVLAAAGGSDAIELARAHAGPIDLLLTDIVMPHMLGHEVATAIAALHPDIQVIYVSGAARSSLAPNEALDPGVLLLEKPFSENDLVRVVRRALAASEDGRGRPPGS